MIIANRYAQIEVLKILYQRGITMTEVADELGCTVQTLSYQLNSAKHFDSDMESLIYKYFAKRGVSKNQEGEVKMIADQLLEHAALTNHQLSLLTKTVKDILADKNITDDERANALRKVRSFRNEVSDSLNVLEGLINGSCKPINVKC